MGSIATKPGAPLRVLVVSKKTTYEHYVQDEKDPHFQELVAANHPSVARLKQAHDDHVATLAAAKGVLAKLGVAAIYQVVGTEAPVSADLVVTLGGDGTLLWVSHIVGADVPMIAINTAPKDSVGYFCAGDASAMESLLSDAVNGRHKETQLTRLRLDVNGQVLTRRVLNDLLFCHRVPAATTRYDLTVGARTEAHKSSGVWVGTAAGSTAAIRSAGGDVMPFDSQQLQYVVREPYGGDGSAPALTRGMIAPGEVLKITSKTPTGSVYLDGPYRAHEIPMGAELVMRRSEEPLRLLGLRSRVTAEGV